MIFLLDADDVIFRTGEQKVKWIKENLTDEDIRDKSRTIDDIKPYECSLSLLKPIIGIETYIRMVGFVYSRKGTLPTSPLEGALEGIKGLSNLGKIYVVSARTVEQTENVKELCSKNDFSKYFADISSTHDAEYVYVKKVAGSKKVGIAKNIGARMFVDDDSRHMPNKPVDGLDCLLFGEAERKDIAPHIIVKRTWQDVVDYARTLTR